MLPKDVSQHRRSGTRFRLFPQAPFLEPFTEPETVWVSPAAGSVRPGPADDYMYVIDPVGKRRPYGLHWQPSGPPYLYLPPWEGETRPPAHPNEAGHFDHLEVGTPEFEAAHLYGTVRWVLDVWENYFGRRIQGHFRHTYDRLELVLLPQMDNAFMGYGFLEVGAHTTETGDVRPFSLNFDVIAHEVGHSIIYSEVGLPLLEGTETGEYFGFHESAADLVALVSVLHFDSVVDDLLETTRGNLYTLNKLNRIVELSKNEQVRIASNDYTLSDFSRGWTDEHELAQPLTGAMFDIFVDIFHENLLEKGLISQYVEDLADRVEYRPEYQEVIQSLFNDAYEEEQQGFREALLEARDRMGTYLAETWSRLSPDFLGYDDVAATLLDVDDELTGGRYQQLIRVNFHLRDIGFAVVGPKLLPPSAASHAFSVRTVVPHRDRNLPPPSYHERMEIARGTAAWAD